MDISYDITSIPTSAYKVRIQDTLDFYRDQYPHVERYVEIKTHRVGMSDAHRLEIRIGKFDMHARIFLDYEFDIQDIRGAIIGCLHSFLTKLN